MGRSRYKIQEQNYPYFHTCTTVGWLPVFTRPKTVQIVLDSFNYLQTNEDFVLYGYVIMENHLHFISASANQSTHIRRFKSYTAQKIIDYLEEKNVEKLLSNLAYYCKKHKTDSRYQFWQEGTHAQQIINGDMMRQKLDYIHMNPVKRGYVDEPTHWRRSSARNYAGLQGVIEVTCKW